MHRYVMYIEQFWALFVDPALDDDHKKAVLAMYKHYRRMTLCMAAKEMPPEHGFDKIIDVDCMKNMYKKYVQE